MSTLTPPDSPLLTGSAHTDARIGSLIANRYRLVDVLGIGAYGTVYKAKDLLTGQYYAVKALNRVGLDPRQQKFQTREIELHYRASLHPNVLSMYDIIANKDCVFVLLEYCPEGDLFAKITENGHYVRNDDAARRVFLQILRAVQFCHSQGIYHRDLKPENIMVTDHGYSVKLADFGLATRDAISHDFGCGSTFYMSPECQQSHPRPAAWYHSAANDVWALGVVLINLTCGRNPWRKASLSDSTYKAFRKDGDFLKTILPISNELNYVLQRVFEVDPMKRISLNQLIHLMENIANLTVSDEIVPQPITHTYTPNQSPPVQGTTSSPVRHGISTAADTSTGTNAQFGLVDNDNVPAFKLPSPQYTEIQPTVIESRPTNALPTILGSAGVFQYQLPPSPPSSDRGSMDFSQYTTRPGQQQKPAYLVDPTYNIYYHAGVHQWNACAGMQCAPAQWALSPFTAHHSTVY